MIKSAFYKIIIISVLIIVACGYMIFYHKKYDYVAGVYIGQTYYEKINSKDKIYSNNTDSFWDDKYKLNQVKGNNYEMKNYIFHFPNSVNSFIKGHTYSYLGISQYDYIIKALLVKNNDLLLQQNRLNEKLENLKKLENYIFKFEPNTKNIRLYEYEINQAYIETSQNKDLIVDLINQLEDVISKFKKEKIELKTTIAKFEKERLKKDFELERIHNDRIEAINREVNSNINNQRFNYKTNKPRNDFKIEKSYEFEYLKSKNYNTIDDYKYNTTNYNSSSGTNSNHVFVEGYTKSNGTYVQGYYRTAPNSSIYDNFSTKPNINPYTGEIGTVKP